VGGKGDAASQIVTAIMPSYKRRIDMKDTVIVIVEVMGSVLEVVDGEVSTPRLFIGPEKAAVIKAAEKCFRAICKENGVDKHNIEGCIEDRCAIDEDWTVHMLFPDVEQVG
jgi:hypothetical protein